MTKTSNGTVINAQASPTHPQAHGRQEGQSCTQESCVAFDLYCINVCSTKGKQETYTPKNNLSVQRVSTSTASCSTHAPRIQRQQQGQLLPRYSSTIHETRSLLLHHHTRNLTRLHVHLACLVPASPWRRFPSVDTSKHCIHRARESIIQSPNIIHYPKPKQSDPNNLHQVTEEARRARGGIF